MRKLVQKISGILSFAAVIASFQLEAQKEKGWSPAGPVFTAGRARNMVVDKNDATGNTLYVGSTSSGIFKSTNGGVEWSPLDDQGTVRNISYLAQAPDGTIYAATGEGFLRTGQKAKALLGTGLYRLSGNSLVNVVGAAVVGDVINRVAVSPANSAMIVLTTNTGIWVSNNAGNSFSALSLPSSSVQLMGMDAKFDNTGVLYCSIGSVVGTTNTPASKVYKSTDPSLSTMIDITPTSSVLGDSNYGRIELAVSPSNNNVVYASCANKNTSGNSASSSSLKALFVSYNGGNNWAMVLQGSPSLDPLSYTGLLASGDYAHVVVVNPSNPNEIFYGGHQMFVFSRTVGAPGDSDNSPIGTWTKLGNHFAVGSPIYLHENFHDVKIIPGNPTRFFFITDAGIFRSTDLTSVSQQIPPSFQPFYFGLVTGQFNSVSIERYPVGANATSTVGGTAVTPYSGFVGGTGGSGMTYYSGTAQQVTQEQSYLTGDVYNTEFSKILPNAAFTTLGTGAVYRTSNVKSSAPNLLQINKYTGVLSKVSGEAEGFTNTGVATGTPFRLWEYYGQTPVNPDKIFFYNDTVRLQASMSTTTELTTSKTFSFAATRPNRKAIIDSVVIRTSTVALPGAATPPTFLVGQYLAMRTPTNLVLTNSLTVVTNTQLTNKSGPFAAESNSIVFNNNTQIDQITVTFNDAPFATITSTNPAYFRVFATVFYRYSVGDSVFATDNNISTKINNYNSVLTQSLSWRYGTPPAYTLNVTQNPALINVSSYSVANTLNGSQSFSSLPIVVRPVGVRSYTVTQFGTYTMSARPVVYTLSATTDTNVGASPSYTFILTPGGNSVVANATVASVNFTVAPVGVESYTIAQLGGTITAETYSTVGASTYVLLPDNISQADPVFSVNITSPNQSYTIEGQSSNVADGANTSITFTNFPIRTVVNAGSGTIPFPVNNPRIAMNTFISARLAVSIAHNAVTGGLTPAVAVSKNPLALNDPLSFVRVSQSGCKTDDANGNPTENTIVIPGRATVLEWSKTGTELYYATDANEIYRVSHITEIQDLSPSSYNGKFFTDIFAYNQSSPHTPNASVLNPNSPYRTTRLGSFDAPITSISITSDSKNMVVTFSPAGSATTSAVMYANGDITKTVSWVAAGSGSVVAPRATYCSLIEKDDDKKVFVGTDEGLFYTNNITASPVTWVSANDGITDSKKMLPRVQIFDIEQQVMEPWDCFNSGQIYIATNGRGIWSNSDFLETHYVGVSEQGDRISKGNNLSLYPNPANSSFNVAFSASALEQVEIQVMDLSGRLVKTEFVGNVESGENVIPVDARELHSGIYIVNVSSSSGEKRVAKLIITK